MEQVKLKNDVVKLQQILGSKLYSNKYSFISEVMQNATDSMRRAGKQDEYFEAGISEDMFFFVRDYGKSFENKEDIVTYLCTLLESSKSQVKNNDDCQEIGKYGIGKIASAAYNSEWFYKIYKNGKGIDLKVFEIEGKGLFYEFTSDYYDTEEKDGVLYKIKLTNSVNDFIKNLLEKSTYFQNVKFVFPYSVIALDRNLLSLNENFKIYKSDDFQYSTINKKEWLHICLDQYSYDINWQKLNMPAIKLPVGIRFSLDEIEVNPTREVLILNDSHISLIQSKIEKVLQWFRNKYNEQYPIKEYEYDIHEYNEDYSNQFNTYSINLTNDVVINIKSVIDFYNRKDFNLPILKNISRSEYEGFIDIINRYKNHYYNCKYSIYQRKVKNDGYSFYLSKDKCFLLDEKLSLYKKDYFRNFSRDRIYFVEEKPVTYVMWKDDNMALNIL